MNDIFIRYIYLPITVRASTVPDGNGDYNIYVNKNLSFEQQSIAIEHEKEHIYNKDFQSNFDVTVLEEKVKKKIG